MSENLKSKPYGKRDILPHSELFVDTILYNKTIGPTILTNILLGDYRIISNAETVEKVQSRSGMSGKKNTQTKCALRKSVLL